MKSLRYPRSPLLHFALAVACSSPLANAAAQEVQPVEDSPIRSFVLIDQLEYLSARGSTAAPNSLRVNSTAWLGGDYNRLWIYTEATKPVGGDTEDIDVQILYGRLVAPFWDVQAGIRYFKPAPGFPVRKYAVLGVQGLAPYRFGVQAATFLSEHGKISARAEIEYDLLLTQRWVLQPRLAATYALQDDKDYGVGKGLNDLEIGLRVRYEIRREFAPYLGITWQKRYSNAGEMATNPTADTSQINLVAGLRVWF